MNINIHFNKLVLVFIFIIMPFFDMLNGYLVINHIIPEGGIASPSQLGRIGALCLLVLSIYYQKIDIKYVSYFFLYFLVVDISSALFHQSSGGAVSSIVNSSKVFYLLLLVFVMPQLIKTKENFYFFISLVKFNIYLISFSILISFIFGIGNSTYGWGIGTKGFFASGNSLGVYLGTLSILLMSLKKSKVYTNINNLSFLLVPVTILLLGSKTALLLGLVLILYWSISTKFKYIIFPLMMAALFIYAEQIINGALELFEVIISRYEVSDDLISFIGSGRINYVNDAFEVFYHQSPSLSRYMFGMGSFTSFQDPNSLHLIYDTLETDFFDVLFMYGLVGLGLYLSLFFIGIKMMSNNLFLVIPFSLLFFHSLFAGHVVFNGMSALAISIFYTVAIYLSKDSHAKNNN